MSLLIIKKKIPRKRERNVYVCNNTSSKMIPSLIALPLSPQFLWKDSTKLTAPSEKNNLKNSSTGICKHKETLFKYI